MDNNNNQAILENIKTKVISDNEDLSLRKANLMANRRRYYIAENRQSEFVSLPGHLQRAIEREANFQTDSLVKSNTYAPHLNDKNAKELFDAHCEYYAHIGLEQDKINPHNPQNLFKILVSRDSDANKGFAEIEGTHDRKTSRHAVTIDMEADRIKTNVGKFNPQNRINALLAKQNIRS